MLSAVFDLELYTCLNECISALGVTGDGTIVAGTVGGQVAIIGTNDVLEERAIGKLGVLSLCWSRDERQVVVGTASGEVIVLGSNGFIDSFDFSAPIDFLFRTQRGEFLVGTGRDLCIIDSDRIRTRMSLPVHLDGLAVRGPHIVATGSSGVWVINQDDLSITDRLARATPVRAFASSVDGRFVARGEHDNRVHLWDRATGNEYRSEGYDFDVEHLAFVNSSPNLVIGGWSELIVWQIGSEDPFAGNSRKIQAHAQCVIQLKADHGEANRLASADAGGTVCVWDFGRPDPLLCSVRAPAAVTALAWSPSSEHLVIGSTDGAVSLLRLGDQSVGE